MVTVKRQLRRAPSTERDLLRLAADLLYMPDDKRHTPLADTYANRVILGQMRSELRGMADDLEHEADQPIARAITTYLTEAEDP